MDTDTKARIMKAAMKMECEVLRMKLSTHPDVLRTLEAYISSGGTDSFARLYDILKIA